MKNDSLIFLRGINNQFLKFLFDLTAGVTQLARVTAFQAVGRGFESRLPLFFCFQAFGRPGRSGSPVSRFFLKSNPRIIVSACDLEA